ncbi:MAG: spermidine/putrescine ABC transporter substrate-binding protein [Truepera sp.]|nr:spermidine/putrescine ABC transporter substrate-binding protein [Truepera sp.]
MRKLVAIGLVALLSLGLAQTRTLHLLTWSEYIDPDIVAQFEAEFDARIVIDTFESNEDALAKLKAAGLGVYDLVVPTDYIIPTFLELGLLQPLDHSRLPNLDNLAKNFRNPPFDPGNTYTVAYQWGTTGIAFRKDIVEPPTSWEVIFNPQSHGHPVALLDSMREMIGLALLYLGHDFNSENREELVQARELLIRAKEGSIGFYGSPAARNLLLTGDAVYAVVYSGDALGALAEGLADIDFVIPSEGGEIWVDNLAIVANAPNADLAHEFINFILRPEIGAQLSNFLAFSTPNQAALPFIDEALKANPYIYPEAQVLERLHYIEDVANLELWDLIWTQVRAR